MCLALSGLMNNVAVVTGNPADVEGGDSLQAAPYACIPTTGPMNDSKPVNPEIDKSAHSNMESMLKHQVENSAKVNA